MFIPIVMRVCVCVCVFCFTVSLLRRKVSRGKLVLVKAPIPMWLTVRASVRRGQRIVYFMINAFLESQSRQRVEMVCERLEHSAAVRRVKKGP